MRISATLALLLAALVAAAPAHAGNLTVEITGVKPKGGRVVVALYDKEPMFGPGAAFSGTAAVAADATVRIVIPDVPAGDYVVSAFHDADADGKVGMTGGKLSEGTALSNAERLRGAPNFETNKVSVANTTAIVTVAMSYPEDRSGW